MSFKIFHGDCLEILQNAPDNSMDSIVTDPPYGLNFMGKKWDYDVPTVEIWKECLRVLKPGGHLLAFGGTRTYHRLVVAIEDAGFEIRDQIQWIYGSGFPKSQNIQKEGMKKDLCCGCETQSEHAVRQVSGSDISTTIDNENESGEVLQSILPEQGAPSKGTTSTQTLAGRGQESCLEGGSNLQAQQGKLYRSEVCSVPSGVSSNVQEGRVRDGASTDHSSASGKGIDENGSSPSQRPQHEKQSPKQSGTVANQRKPQARRSGESCGRCSKPIIDAGLGTALKPANEPICLARKPLSESTIAKNVLKHGTGGLNIDAGRIEGEKRDPGFSDEYFAKLNGKSTHGFCNGITATKEIVEQRTATGRFPSNVILDEDAAQVLDGQSGVLKSRGEYKNRTERYEVDGNTYKFGGNLSNVYANEVGGASRFFYVAKASKAERNYGCEDLPIVECGVGDDRPSGQSMQRLDGRETRAMQNTHPTVKPIKLMEYLIKLVTPEGGIVLDPFMGSGTTGVAALRNGFQFRGIEREENYFYISQARLEKEDHEDAV